MKPTCRAIETKQPPTIYGGTMRETVAAKLQQARSRLDELAKLTNELAVVYPSVFENRDLREQLNAFSIAHAEAKRRLASPTLSIATIGTTSSGKSTIVNALVGRRIAPIDSAEMSGGILTLRDANERKLTIEETDNTPWESGTWAGLSDGEMYTRIRDNVMRSYHKERKERSCLAPQVVCEGPLLPVRDSEVLGTPPDLGIELIDLPGLKSVQDQANLAVIQTRVHKAFSLVALDYLQTNEEHRKKLLEELTRVVKYLDGRTDSMIFVLNRVDQRGEDDEPIAVRIQSLRREIQEVLELDHEPDVIPFEARLLYRAQCAWGPNPDGESKTRRETKLEHVGALFKECASTIERHAEADESLEDWLLGVKRAVRNKQELSSEDLRRLLLLAYEWSGGTILYQRLKIRIEESFAELVILPTLIEVFESHEALLSSLRTISGIRKIESREQLDQKLKQLETLQDTLHEEVSATRDMFRERLTTATEKLKSGEMEARYSLTNELGPGFEALLSAVGEITDDLTTSLILPTRDALLSDRGVYDFEESLQELVNPRQANDLARAYDLFKRHPQHMERDGSTLSKRTKTSDEKGVAELTEIERDVRRLYSCVEESITHRAMFLLQGRAKDIEHALLDLMEQQSNELKSALLRELSELPLEQALESARKATIKSTRPTSSSALFEMSGSFEQRQENKQEVIGKREVEEEYVDGSHAPEGAGIGGMGGAAVGAAVAGPIGALIGGILGSVVGGAGGATVEVKKKRKVTEDVVGTVSYSVIELPDENGMAMNWSESVGLKEDALWETLQEWMIETLRDASANFVSSVEGILRLAERSLKEQQRIASEEYTETLALWKDIDREISRLEASSKSLQNSTQSASA